MIGVIELAAEVGARASCEALGVPGANYYRWTPACAEPGTADRSPSIPKEPLQSIVRAPSHRALSDREKQGVLDTLHSDRFLDRSPAHVVAQLLGEGIWLSSDLSADRQGGPCTGSSRRTEKTRGAGDSAPTRST